MNTRLDEVRAADVRRSRLVLAVVALVGFWMTAWALVVVRLVGSTGDWDNPTTDPPRRLSDGLFAAAAVLVVASGPVAYWIGRRRWLLRAPVALVALAAICFAVAEAT